MEAPTIEIDFVFWECAWEARVYLRDRVAGRYVFVKVFVSNFLVSGFGGYGEMTVEVEMLRAA
jgi:hypothetical protein